MRKTVKFSPSSNSHWSWFIPQSELAQERFLYSIWTLYLPMPRRFEQKKILLINNIAKGTTDQRHWVLWLTQRPLFKAKASSSFEILIKLHLGFVWQRARNTLYLHFSSYAVSITGLSCKHQLQSRSIRLVSLLASLIDQISILTGVSFVYEVK